MANSRKSQSIDCRIRKALADTFALIAPDDSPVSISIAYSGGLDSTVLLDATQRYIRDNSLQHVCLAAFHLNHGISSNADAWQAHCEQECQNRTIPLEVRCVKLAGVQSSVELAARTARYSGLNDIKSDHFLLAHHQDDQAETVLLNLFRGSGLLGAAGIPLHRGRMHRPLLMLRRTDLLEYAEKHGLHWVEDESNASLQFSRNYLRLTVLPRILERFPGAVSGLSIAAENFAEAQQLLEQLAEEDGAGSTTLSIEHLRQLQMQKGTPRARNLLLTYLRRRGIRIPSREWFDEVFRQALQAKADAQLVFGLETSCIRRFQGYLYVTETQAAHPRLVTWHFERHTEWGNGSIRATCGTGIGLAKGRLTGRLLFRTRQGGERILLGSMHRALKDLLREAGIPPWQRQELPLLFHEDELIWIPGVAIAENYRSLAEEDGIQLEFVGPNW